MYIDRCYPKKEEKEEEALSWKWKDDSAWKEYDDVTTEQIEAAWNSNAESVSLNKGSYFGASNRQNVYKIDFDKNNDSPSFVQINTSTNFKRKVQRTGPPRKDPKKKEEEQQENDKQKDDKNENDAQEATKEEEKANGDKDKSKENKQEEEEDEELDEALLSKYPMFIEDEEGKNQCIFVYLHKELSSQLEPHSFKEEQHCITAPPQLNGPTLKWDESLLDQHIGPETFLYALPNQAILISIRCAYFADNQPLMIPVCSAWQMKQVKKAFIAECKLDSFDNINEDDSKLAEEKVCLFPKNIPLKTQ